MRVLVAMPVNDKHKTVLCEASQNAEIIYMEASNVDVELLKTVDVVVGNVKPTLLKGLKNIKLVQLNSAGTDGYTDEGILSSNTTLTNATGAYGVAISEHMIAMLLSQIKKINMYYDNCKENLWKDFGPVTSIYGTKTLVVGLGDIGNEFAKRMHAFGSEVSAVKRRESAKPDYIKNVYKMEELNEIISDFDFVASSLPGTPETYKVFNKDVFSHMKETAYFINVGRGNAVDSNDLADALNEGLILGACLDVTDPEPLPKDHKLWDARGILITPHVSGGFHLQETHDRIIKIAANNIKHLLNGEPFESVVDMKTGYRK